MKYISLETLRTPPRHIIGKHPVPILCRGRNHILALLPYPLFTKLQEGNGHLCCIMHGVPRSTTSIINYFNISNYYMQRITKINVYGNIQFHYQLNSCIYRSIVIVKGTVLCLPINEIMLL